MIYLIGSLRNGNVPIIGKALREAGYEVFDDWHAAGPEADDHWQAYETERGHSYGDALKGWAAKHVFEFDLFHLGRADCGVLVMPAGRSGHLELGYLIGQGKPGYVLFDKTPERYDVMYQFCTGVYFDLEELLNGLASAKHDGLSSTKRDGYSVERRGEV